MQWNGEERRKFLRIELPCKIIVTSPIRFLTSHTENIGEGGIRVLLEEKLSVFSIVGIEIYLGKERPLKCKGRIVWVKEKVNPLEKVPIMFDTGIQFIEINDCDREYIRKLVESCCVNKNKKKNDS